MMASTLKIEQSAPEDFKDPIIWFSYILVTKLSHNLRVDLALPCTLIGQPDLSGQKLYFLLVKMVRVIGEWLQGHLGPLGGRLQGQIRRPRPPGQPGICH